VNLALATVPEATRLIGMSPKGSSNGAAFYHFLTG